MYSINILILLNLLVFNFSSKFHVCNIFGSGVAVTLVYMGFGWYSEKCRDLRPSFGQCLGLCKSK